MLHLRGLITHEALVSTDQGLNHRLPWALVWSLRSVHGELHGQGGGFQCSPQDLRLTWPSDHPSFYRDFGTDKVMTHLQTRSLKLGRRANSQHTQRARRNFLSWSRSPPQGVGVQRLPRTNGDIPGWEQWSPTPQLPFRLWFPNSEALIKFGITMCKGQCEFCLLCHVTCLSKQSVRAAVNLLTMGLAGRWPGGPTKFLRTLCYLAWKERSLVWEVFLLPRNIFCIKSLLSP